MIILEVHKDSPEKCVSIQCRIFSSPMPTDSGRKSVLELLFGYGWVDGYTGLHLLRALARKVLFTLSRHKKKSYQSVVGWLLRSTIQLVRIFSYDTISTNNVTGAC